LIDVPRGLEDKLYQGDLRQRCDAVPAPVDCGLRLGINQLAIPIEAQKRPPGVVPARDQVAARQQILGCGLTTAEIVYRRPDRHWLLQTYVWNPEAMLAFSVWYATQGLGRIQSMLAFDAKSFETAIKDAAG
jgi:hypothetical protein